MELDNLLRELEKIGYENDLIETDKSKKYLNITRDTGQFLKLIVKTTKAKRILEVGTSNGYSTLWLASGVEQGGHIYTIERCLEKIRQAQDNFKRSGLNDKITLIQGDAQEIISKKLEPFDCIFLDADRSVYMAMIEDVLRLLNAGGLLICDNAVSHQKELEPLMNYFNSNSHFLTSLVPVGKGEFLVYKMC